MRVIKWIVDRVHGTAEAVTHPLGRTPRYDDMTWSGLDFSPETFDKLMSLSKDAGLSEVAEQAEYFDKFGDRLPPELTAQREGLASRLAAGPDIWRPGS